MTTPTTGWQRLADVLTAALEQEQADVRAAMAADPDLTLEFAIAVGGSVLHGFAETDDAAGAMAVTITADELSDWPVLDDGGIWGPGYEQAIALDRAGELLELSTTAPDEPWGDIAFPIPDGDWVSGRASSGGGTLPGSRCEHGHDSMRDALDCAAERRAALGMPPGVRETPSIIIAEADGSPVLQTDAEAEAHHWTHDPDCPHRRGLSGRCRWCGDKPAA